MKGVIAAAPTPVTESGAPIRDLFVEHGLWALANGCDGLNILGSTGEANSLPAATRRTVMAWAAEAFPKEKLMVGTATPSLEETIAMTEAADDLGYPVALVLPPYYYKPLSDDGLVGWYMAIHRALGDRPIQIYFYNYPQMTGMTIPVAVIARLAELAPKRFTGIKDSSGDLDYGRALVAANGSLAVFPSSETALDVAESSGFAGCISATVNFTAAIAGRQWAARTAPLADLSAQLAAQRGAIAAPNLVARVKYLVSARTGDPAWRRVVPPFVAVEDDEGAALLAQVEGAA